MTRLLKAPQSAWLLGGRFVLVLLALQLAWFEARGTAIERTVIDRVTVGCAVQLLHLLSPALPIHAQGSRIVAPGGGINVLNGCEGTETLFLLFAALAAAPLSARSRLSGLLVGTVWIFAWNQVRLIVLFYSYRTDRVWFEHLHGLIAPLVLVALVLLFFVAWLRRDARIDQDSASAAAG